MSSPAPGKVTNCFLVCSGLFQYPCVTWEPERHNSPLSPAATEWNVESMTQVFWPLNARPIGVIPDLQISGEVAGFQR